MSRESRSRRATAMRASAGFVTLLMLAGATVGPVVAASPGELDQSFAAGTQKVDIRGTTDRPSVVLARPDGRILVGVTSLQAGSPSPGVDPAFAQLSTSGAPDPSFGDAQGHRIVDLGTSEVLLDAALGSDGKIVALTFGRRGQFLFRLDPDGSLDSNSDADPASHFGQTGIVPVAFGFGRESWRHVAVQADGSVVVAGSLSLSRQDPLERTAVVRFTSTGVVDPSFGPAPGGPVIFALGDGASRATALAISPAGSSIAMAVDASQGGQGVLGLAMLHTSDGSFDNTFSQDGRLTTAIGQKARTDSVVVQADDRIVLGGTVDEPGPQHPVVLRYTNAGTLDPGFGNGGVFQPVFVKDASLDAVRLTSAGNVLALTSGFVAAIRLTASGRFDPAFDHDGRMSITIPGHGSFVTGGTLAPGDRPVLLSTVDHDDLISHAGVTRLTAAGLPDTSFAPAGTARSGLDPGQNDEALAVAITSSGKILLAGDSFRTDGSVDFTLLRLTRQGYPDHGFGVDGRAAADFGSDDDQARDLALAGTRILAVGCTSCRSGSRFALARFTRRGALDTSFGGDGKVTSGFGPGVEAHAAAVAIQTDGRIVVAGTADGDFAVARYTSAGLLDHSFSGNGKVVTDVDHGSLDRASDVAIQDDGKIIVVGTRLAGMLSRFAMVRYTAAGVLDPTFGTDGIVISQIGAGAASSSANAVALRPDGRILVAGDADSPGGASMALARYRTNGTPDPTFSGDGQLTEDFGATGVVEASAVIPVAGNRILFGGFGSGRFIVGRYLANGTLDTTFNGQGFTETAIGQSAEAFDMAVDPSNGRIVLAGQTALSGTAGDEDVAVARYEP